MLLHRVRMQGEPARWMASHIPYASAQSSLKLKFIKNSSLFKEAPCVWLEKEDAKFLDEEVEVPYSELLSPVQLAPPMVYGLGLNYASHSAETKMDVPKLPIVIGKSPTSICAPNWPIEIPKVCPEPEVDFEAELAIIIGRECKNVSKADAMKYVLGFTCGNDVSARRWQGKKGGGQWTRAKSFDTFMPLGPSILVADSNLDPQNLAIRSKVAKNGSKFALMQEANTKDMIFGVASLVEFLSQGTTLYPWTVILTGTPAGVGYTRQPAVYLEPGDSVQIEIDGIGPLLNPVQAED